MDNTQKFLSKLEKKELEKVLNVLKFLKENQLDLLDIKKIQGHKNLYRTKVGAKIRIVFEKENGKNKLINIDYRKNIYKNL